ncbi:MAG: MFS transporter [Dermatophilaceae bacterium]
MFLAAADTYVVVLALTDMMAGVGLGVEALQRATPIVSGFLLGYVAILPLVGRLADLAERRRVLVACLWIFLVGSVVTAMAVELGVLVGGRFLQGVGGGGLVPATMALVADLWPPDRRGLPLGIVGGVQELGAVAGPVLGAAILTLADWRAIFWVNSSAAALLILVLRALAPPTSRGDPQPRRHRLAWRLGVLLVAALALLTLAAPQRLVADVTLGIPFVPLVPGSRLLTPIGIVTLALVVGLAAYRFVGSWALLQAADLPGAALLATALGALVLTFATAAPEREIVGPSGLALVPIAALASAGVLWRQRSSRDPLVPRRLVRGRMLWACLVSALVGVALVAVVVDVPLLARLTLTDSQTEAALVLVRFLVAVPIGALIGGWVLRYAGPALVASTGLLLAGAGLAVMAGWGSGSLAGPAATPVLACVGVGLGLSLAPVNAAALASARPKARGVAAAIVVVARMVGMVLGLALLTAFGLHRYFAAVAELADPTDPRALVDAAVVQVRTVFAGGCAAAVLAVAGALRLGGRAG